MNGQDRCHERDTLGNRCTIEGEHQEITNSKGQRANAHQTKTSMWSTPLSDLVVTGTGELNPSAVYRMMDEAYEGRSEQ